MAPYFIANHPLAAFFISLIVLWGSAWIGAFLRKRYLQDTQQEDLGIMLGATLTLLGIIIGFSFSMATSRYDQRKNYEEAEANAIGTEYVRADFLPTAEAAKVRSLMRSYLEERILFYTVSDDRQLQHIDVDTAQLQDELWSAVRLPAEAKPTMVSFLVASGMNDVLNSQGYTQAAWWNRIPTAAWALMVIIAICSSALVGFAVKQPIMLLLMPFLASIAFMLIADLDSPRGGLIHVSPQNLISLSRSLSPH